MNLDGISRAGNRVYTTLVVDNPDQVDRPFRTPIIIALPEGEKLPAPGSSIEGDLILSWFNAATSEQKETYLADPAPISPSDPTPAQTWKISFRQFYQRLYQMEIITDVELIAAVKSNDMPAALATLVDAMPAEQKLQAQVLIYGATEIERYHPMTVAIVDAFGWTVAEGDDFFVAAGKL